MAAGSTYSPIATTTVSGGSTNTVTFNSISGSYTDIKIIANHGMSVNDAIWLRFNNDSGTGSYSRTTLFNAGGSAVSGRSSNDNLGIYMGDPDTNLTNNMIVDVMNYSNSTTYKTALSKNKQDGNARIYATVGLWRSTSAITRIDFVTNSGYFLSGSTFTLYGISAA